MTLHEFNLLPITQLKSSLFNCCGSMNWVDKMMPFFPMEDLVELLEDAEEQWYTCIEEDWLEAFSHLPKISDFLSDHGGLNHTAYRDSQEKMIAETNLTPTLNKLIEFSKKYENKFGFPFVVCSNNNSVEEVLPILQHRFTNKREIEIKIAMDEQNKITLLRLQKLLL